MKSIHDEMNMLAGKFDAEHDNLTWADIAKDFPNAGPQFDAQGGDVWLGDNQPHFVVSGKNLAIGYDSPPHAKWALWNESIGRWLFVGRPSFLEVKDGRITFKSEPR